MLTLIILYGSTYIVFFNLFGSDPMKWRVMEDEFVNIKESSYQSKAVSPCFSLLDAYF
jgi:hypothetical protein